MDQVQIDEQCFMCTNFFSCNNRFKVANCENFERDWGHCRKCTRIVSPRHSNCPNCGNRDIKPILEKERKEKLDS